MKISLQVLLRCIGRIRVSDRCVKRPTLDEKAVWQTGHRVQSPTYCSTAVRDLCFTRMCWSLALLLQKAALHNAQGKLAQAPTGAAAVWKRLSFRLLHRTGSSSTV